MPQMKPGYCYVASTMRGLLAENTECYTPNGAEVFIRKIYVDNPMSVNGITEMNVWRCPDGKLRAQMVTLTGE